MAGYPPFQGRDEYEILSAIKKEDIDFDKDDF